MANGKLSENAITIAENRYFMEGEDWESCTGRVGQVVSSSENSHMLEYAAKFGEIIYNLDFLPGGRILRNAGRQAGSLFNCYNVPIGDSRKEIGQFYMDSLILWGEGGGVGVNLTPLRPKGAPIKTVGGVSSGPVSFLIASDAIAKTIESGGSRRAAALALMHVMHPDIMDIIDAKIKQGVLPHYNISVAVNDSFLEAVESKKDWEFKFAHKSYGKVNARDIWDKIISNMVECAEPGLLNWDYLIKNNSYYYDPVTGTNPSLRKGTRILTSDGIFNIETLQDREVMVPNLDGKYSLANCILSGHNKVLYKIILEGQHAYYCTAEHKWPVINSGDIVKVKTIDLKPNDFLLFQNKIDSLPFGKIGDYNDGFIIGWNLGDGWITERSDDGTTQIGFIVSEGDKYEGIDSIISKYLIDKCKWKGNFDDKNEINVNNKSLNKIFEMFKVQHKSKGLPLSVWNDASEEFRKGLIDGLFSSDGCFSDRIVFTTSNEKLAMDVSDLLGFYGLKCGINKQEVESTFPNGKDYGKLYTRYDVKIGHQNSIKHFHKLFKISNKSKQVSLELLIKDCRTYCEDKIKIISIEQTNIFEDVWDLRVFDNSHCFQLAHCITGNCGEAVLEPYGVCDLGSVVLPNFITGTVNTNWKKLEEVIKLAIRFLDNVIDVNKYTLQEVDIKAHNSRRVGLGVMGLAEYLFAKKLRYGSEKAIAEIERLMRFMREVVYETLVELAREKGAFPKFDPVPYGKASFIRKLPASLRMDIKEHGVRCVTGMAVAPTGTISLLADVNSSIEPLFRKAYLRNDRVSARMYIHPIYKQLLESGEDTPDWYVDTDDLKPSDHFEVQSVVQKYVDGAVSKTINMPKGTTPAQLSKLTLEYIHDLKGVTVYIDGSKEGQVLNKVDEKEVKLYLEESKTKNSADIEAVKCATGACEM